MSDGAAPAAGTDPASPAGPRIALALGGGSARGLAHIAILEALEELGLRPAAIAGTSMGSICGAMYAAGVPAAEVRAGFVAELGSRAAFMARYAGRVASGLPSLWSVRSPSAIDSVTLFEMVLPEALHSNFESLLIPFKAVAADLYAVDQVVLERGPLIPALAASCALPAWAQPVVIDGRVLIDGGYVNPVPFDVVMDTADITVAVDVTGDPGLYPGAKAARPPQSEARRGAIQLLFHSVTREKLRARAPDIMIRPAVGGFSALDFFRIEEILAAAEAAKEELKRELSQRLGDARPG
jgi:NTE family protein